MPSELRMGALPSNREDRVRAWAQAQSESHEAPDPEVSELAVFRAVLAKNWKLKGKGLIACCSVCEILVPLIFLGLLCLPRYLIADTTHAERFYSPVKMSDIAWSKRPPSGGAYRLLYAPNTSVAAVRVAEMAGKELLCGSPSFMRQLAMASSYSVDAAGIAASGKAVECASNPMLCAGYVRPREGGLAITSPLISGDLGLLCDPQCLALRSCFGPVLADFLEGYPSESEAVAAAVAPEAGGRVAAVLVLPSDPTGDELSYTIRTNASDVPGAAQFGADWAKVPFNNWVVGPSAEYTMYWLFLNIQKAVDTALISLNTQPSALSAAMLRLSGAADVKLTTSVKAFPYIQYSTNLGGSFAALFFGIIFVFGFLTSVVLILKSLVMEKELRIREGMLMMGLRGRTYWLSWFVTHYSTLVIVATLMALIGTYPFQHSAAIIMWLFYLSWTASLVLFCYALSTLFSTSKIAAVAGSLLYILTWAPAVSVTSGSGALGNPGWTAVCFFPASGIYMWGVAVALLENAELGVTWETLFMNLISSRDGAGSGNFSAGLVIVVTLVSAVCSALMAAYLDRVWPKQFGTTLPLWFPLSAAWWRHGHCGAVASGQGGQGATEDEEACALVQGGCEPAPEGGAAPALALRSLSKSFTTPTGALTAVDNLTLSFYPGHISALLGHNGAGKTTTLGMLCGLLPASGGSACVDGLDVATQMHAIRRRLGVCPQHDILWPTLSCEEHLVLYSAFRGVPRDRAGAQAAAMLAEVGLKDKADAAAGTLSGGQRRKLSLAIAFVGGPRVVMLDEPTSGMDPYSRRFAWDFIRRQKAGRSIVLTTHFMEEADLLSDRIAIMTRGRLACVGSPLFLKARLGLGYHLSLLLSSDAAGGAASSLTSLVEAHVCGSVCEAHVGAELSFLLPADGVAAFPALLRQLDSRAGELGVEGYGISCSSLEEIFLSIAENASAHDGDAHRLSAEALRRVAVERKRAAADVRRLAAEAPAAPSARAEADVPLLTGARLLAQQFRALLLKRALNARRDRLAWATQYLVPLFFVALGLGLSHVGSSGRDYPGAVMGPLYLANKPVKAAAAAGAGDVAAFQAALEAGRAAWAPAPQSLWNCSGARSLGAGAGSSSQLGALASSFGLSLAPDFCEPAITDCAALGCTPAGVATGATLDAALLAHTEAHKNCRQASDAAACAAIHLTSSAPSRRAFAFTLATSPTAFHALPAAQSLADSAAYAALLGRPARLSVRSHPMPATAPPTQGSSLIMNMLVGLCVVLALGSLSASASVFLVAEKRGHSKHLQMVSGVHRGTFWAATCAWDAANYMLPLGLLTCAFAASAVPAYSQDGALAVVFTLLLLFGAAAMPLSYLLHFAFSDEMNCLAAQMGLYFFFGIAQLIAAVVLQGLAALGKAKGAWTTLRLLFRWLPHYNVGIVLFQLTQNASQPDVARVSPWAREVSGTELRCLIAEAFVFMALTLACEFRLLTTAERLGARVWRKLSSSARKRRIEEVGELDGEEDADVAAERRRILAACGDAGDLLTIQGLRKTYRGGKQAVRGLTLGVREGRCFGLLGVNGAGKSSTFKVLTGEEGATEGDALVRGRAGSAAGSQPCSISTALPAVRQRLGLCPQDDGLCARLSCREHLLFYSSVRGVDAAAAPALADALLSRLGLSRWESALAGTLSGGNKRKLSVAIALIGEPPLVLLDEPSSGMDPEARRAMWDVLARSMAGRAVVLTTHVLAEAEALCHEVGIMVDGRLRCLGSVTHLKSAHGGGYTLELRCAPAACARAAAVLAAALPAATLQEEQAGRLTFALPQRGVSLADAFETMERVRAELGIQDYSLTQASLEQIFVAFAQQAADETGGPIHLHLRRRRRDAVAAQLRNGSVDAPAADDVEAAAPLPVVQCPGCKARLRWQTGASILRCGACDALVGLPYV